MAFLGKEYKFVKQENFDSFLRSVGLPDEHIQKLLNDKPVTKLEKNGDTYTYTTTNTEGTRTSTFKSGVEFDDFIDGKTPIKSIYTVDGNTVTQEIKTDKGTATFKREYNGDELVVIITSSAWDGVSKRFYKA